MAVRMEVLTGHLVNVLFRRTEPAIGVGSAPLPDDDESLVGQSGILYHPAPPERGDF